MQNVFYKKTFVLRQYKNVLVEQTFFVISIDFVEFHHI